MKYKKIFFISFLSTFILIFLRGGDVSIGNLRGIHLSILVSGIVYFLLTLFFLKRQKKQLSSKGIVIAILLGSSILELPIHLFRWESTLISFPELPYRWLTIFAAYLYYRWDDFKIRKILLFLFYAILSLWITFKGFDFWLHYLNFGTFTGKVEQAQKEDITFTGTSGESLSIHALKGDYILLDFWYSRCGVCFAKFPHVQKIYEKTRSNDKINVYSIHCYMEDESENYSTGHEILTEEGYRLPVFSINIEDPIRESLGVNAFPTILIFNTERELVFRGNIESAERYLQKLNVLN